MRFSNLASSTLTVNVIRYYTSISFQKSFHVSIHAASVVSMLFMPHILTARGMLS